jgi:hypothetical protein
MYMEGFNQKKEIQTPREFVPEHVGDTGISEAEETVEPIRSTPALERQKTVEEIERDRIRGVLSNTREVCFRALEHVHYRFGIQESVRQALRAPVAYLEKREAIKVFEGAMKDIAKGLTDPELRSESIDLLQKMRKKNVGFSGLHQALSGELSNFVATHIDTVIPQWESDDYETLGQSVELITDLKEIGEYSYSKKNKEFLLERAMQGIEKSVAAFSQIESESNPHEDISDHIEPFLIAAYHRGSPEVSQTAERVFESLIMKQKVMNKNEGCVDAMIAVVVRNGFGARDREGIKKEELDELFSTSEDAIQINPRRELASRVLARIGLDPIRFTEAIAHTSKNEDFRELLEENALAARAIEVERSGAVAVLSQTFGIQAYGRYPKELLVEQFDTIDNASIPYGIIMNPREDHNGAFYGNRHKEIFSELNEQCRAMGYGVRAYECDGKRDVARKLIMSDTRYGKTQKISFAILGAHGNTNEMHFGDSDAKGQAAYFHSTDVEGRGMRRAMSEYFTPNPTIILDSCSVGTEGGIADVFSFVSNAEVIAANKNTSGIESLKVGLNPETGRPHFDVELNTVSGGKTRHITPREASEVLVAKSSSGKATDSI